MVVWFRSIPRYRVPTKWDTSSASFKRAVWRTSSPPSPGTTTTTTRTCRRWWKTLKKDQQRWLRLPPWLLRSPSKTFVWPSSTIGSSKGPPPIPTPISPSIPLLLVVLVKKVLLVGPNLFRAKSVFVRQKLELWNFLIICRKIRKLELWNFLIVRRKMRAKMVEYSTLYAHN